jgi:hypothetical protein
MSTKQRIPGAEGRPLSRRRVLVAGAVAGLGAFLAACGAGGKASTQPSAAAT